MIEPIETAADLHRELVKRGLDLKPEIGRDVALMSEVAAKLGIPPNRLITNLSASNKSAEEYLRALVSVARPFAQMFREIWRFLAQHAAPKTNEQLFIRFGFGKDADDIDWDQFRLYAKSTSKIWSSGLTTLWPIEDLHRLGAILARSLGMPRHSCDYRYRGSFVLPDAPVVGQSEEFVVHVRDAIRSWIESVFQDDLSKVSPNRNLPELLDDDSFSNEQDEELLCLAQVLTDLVPRWSHILHDWSRIPSRDREAAIQFFTRQLAPKLKQKKTEGWLSMLLALDILELPFWRHRWHTYEVWATVKAFAALREFQAQLLIRDGHLAIDGTQPALIATFSANPTFYAYVQSETRIKPLGKRNRIKPDLRFSSDTPASNANTIAIVEFKQRRQLTREHLKEVTTAYSRGVGLKGGVIIINYDSAPRAKVPKNCTIIDNVRPGQPSVDEYIESLRRLFVGNGIVSSLSEVIVLLDVSGSMGTTYLDVSAQTELRKLMNDPALRIFRFNNGLLPGGDLSKASSLQISGGTELGASLEQLFALSEVGVPEKLLIVTDGGHDHPTALINRVAHYAECEPHQISQFIDQLRQQ